MISDYIRDYEQLFMPFRVTYRNGIDTVWSLVNKPSIQNWAIGDHHEHYIHWGKYRGMSFDEIVEEDISYAVDLIEYSDYLSEWERCYLGWLVFVNQ